MSEPGGGPDGVDAERAQAGPRARWRLLAAALAAIVLAALVTRLPLLTWLIGAAAWARAAGLWGALAGGASIALALLLFAPVVPLILLAGWIWGAWGGVVALAAATGSALAAFSLARKLGRNRFGRLLQRSPRVAYVIELAERGGVSTVALLRTAPIMPFTIGNAALGLTRLRMRELAAGTPLGLLPSAVFYIWIGRLLPDAQAIERGEATRILFERRWLLLGLLSAHLVVIAAAALRIRRLHADVANRRG